MVFLDSMGFQRCFYKTMRRLCRACDREWFYFFGVSSSNLSACLCLHLPGILTVEMKPGWGTNVPPLRLFSLSYFKISPSHFLSYFQCLITSFWVPVSFSVLTTRSAFPAVLGAANQRAAERLEFSALSFSLSLGSTHSLGLLLKWKWWLSAAGLTLWKRTAMLLSVVSPSSVYPI